jgi:hypothetical protein
MMIRSAASALGVLLVALAGLVSLEIKGTSRDTDLSLAMPASRAPGPVPTAARMDAGAAPAWVRTILARPVFSPSRRPPPGAAGSDTAGAARLAGIVVSGTSKQAIFAPAGDGKPVVLAVGGRIGALVLTSIEPDQVVVMGPDGEHRLRPAFDHSAPSTTAAAGLQPSRRQAVPAVAEPPNPLAALPLSQTRWHERSE